MARQLFSGVRQKQEFVSCLRDRSDVVIDIILNSFGRIEQTERFSY